MHCHNSHVYVGVDTRPDLPLPTPHNQGSDDDNIYSSPSDDDNDIYSNPHFDGVEIAKMPVQKTTSPPGSAVQMVTGVCERRTKPEKPKTPPKPTKIRIEGTIMILS